MVFDDRKKRYLVAEQCLYRCKNSKSATIFIFPSQKGIGTDDIHAGYLHTEPKAVHSASVAKQACLIFLGKPVMPVISPCFLDARFSIKQYPKYSILLLVERLCAVRMLPSPPVITSALIHYATLSKTALYCLFSGVLPQHSLPHIIFSEKGRLKTLCGLSHDFFVKTPCVSPLSVILYGCTTSRQHSSMRGRFT